MDDVLLAFLVECYENLEQLEIQSSAKRDGVHGSIVLQGVVTELLDLREIVRRRIPGFCAARAEGKQLVSLR